MRGKDIASESVWREQKQTEVKEYHIQKQGAKYVAIVTHGLGDTQTVATRDKQKDAIEAARIHAVNRGHRAAIIL